jgi:hypothetical protein
MRHIKPIAEALKTECQTPDTKYTIKITDTKLSINIALPMKLELSEKEAKLLENNLHNAMELVLAPYFNKED